MAELTRKAMTLIREMLTADGKLPAYNEEVVEQTLKQIQTHQDGINQMLYAINEQRQQDGEDVDPEAAAVNWTDSPQHAGAIVVHHETILKLKRILLTYLRMRTDCLVKVRWQQRVLRSDIKENLSPQEQQFYKDYDKALNKYMGLGDTGIGMDLTLDMIPPKDSNVRVIVERDHGNVAFSHSACVALVKGSTHNIKSSEAEHLVRMGVLRVVESNF